MKQTVTAALALVAAAGLAGAAAAQTMAPQSSVQSDTAQPSVSAPATPAQDTQGAARSFSYQPETAPAAPQASTAGAAPQANMQPSGGDFWSRNISQQEVQQAQEQLKAQGYNGPTDGLMGTSTQRAIARYQRQNGLRESATLDEATLARLTNTTAGVGSSAPANPEANVAPPTAGSNSYRAVPNTAGEQNPYEPSPAAKPMYR